MQCTKVPRLGSATVALAAGLFGGGGGGGGVNSQNVPWETFPTGSGTIKYNTTTVRCTFNKTKQNNSQVLINVSVNVHLCSDAFIPHFPKKHDWGAHCFWLRKNLTNFSGAPDGAGVWTWGLWISSLTLYQLSHPVTLRQTQSCSNDVKLLPHTSSAQCRTTSLHFSHTQLKTWSYVVKCQPWTPTWRQASTKTSLYFLTCSARTSASIQHNLCLKTIPNTTNNKKAEAYKHFQSQGQHQSIEMNVST